MSSKPENKNASRWSLAARLTAWYAGSAFLIVVGVTLFLYWALLRSLNHEDDEVLRDKIRIAKAILEQSPQNLEALKQEVNEAGQAPQSNPVFLRILDEQNRIQAETPGMRETLPSEAYSKRFLPGLDWQGMDWGSPKGNLFRILQENGPRETLIQVGMDRSPEMELLEHYRQAIGIILVLSLIVSSATGYWIAQNGIRPIREITQTAGRIRPDHLSERIRPEGLPLELLELSGTFNAMLDRLEKSFERLSRFSADIAHELRTPLNNLQGEFEVALQKPRSPREYQEVLSSGLEETVRVNRMVESLLFLARAENPQSQINRETLDLDRELQMVMEFYEPTAGESAITLKRKGFPGLSLKANRPLFQRMVGNLIENALRFTPSGGLIELRVQTSGTHLIIEIADNGCGIEENHLPHLFDRFFRIDPVRGNAGGNTGLGLAIVKSIVELHGGTVGVQSKPGQGTVFSLVFPNQ